MGAGSCPHQFSSGSGFGAFATHLGCLLLRCVEVYSDSAAGDLPIRRAAFLPKEPGARASSTAQPRSNRQSLSVSAEDKAVRSVLILSSTRPVRSVCRPIQCPAASHAHVFRAIFCEQDSVSVVQWMR